MENKEEINQLVRRRFYLSPVSLELLDNLALSHNVSPSVLLDSILKEMLKKQKQK